MATGPHLPYRRAPRGLRFGLSLWGVAIFACSGAAHLACASGPQVAPQASVATSMEAQVKLRQLDEQWEVESDLERRRLRPELEEFIASYPTDASTARARIMLAQIAFGERRLAAVGEILAPLVSGPAGSSQDEAQVILAAVDNRRGDYEKALGKLEALEGKLLNREARDQYARERISAAISARRWRLVVSAMIAWLAEDGGNSPEAREWVQSAARNVPPRALARVLSDWSTEEVGTAESNARDWLQRVIILQVTDEALRLQDPLLARDLLERSPTWLRTGESGDELAVLAALAQKEARVSGRAVGVVLGGKTEKERRRSVRVAAGLAAGLKLLAGAKDDTQVRLVAVEDRGSVSAALGTLGGLGATIFVAGVDATSALEALVFAEDGQVPTLLMTDPLVATAMKFGFVLGSSETAEQLAIEGAENGATKWAFIGTEKNGCDIQVIRPGASLLPLAEWRAQGVDGLGVLGDAGCARRIWNQVSQAGWNPVFAVGLEAAQGPLPAATRLYGLGAGEYPSARKKLSDRVTDHERERVAGDSSSGKTLEDWYFLLGYDAGQLVRASLKQLPETQATEKAEVRARHDLARDALKSATGSLKTTDAKGFAGNQRILRNLRVLGMSQVPEGSR